MVDGIVWGKGFYVWLVWGLHIARIIPSNIGQKKKILSDPLSL
jgi:hypothetical protein